MKKQLIFATNNTHKLKEVAAMLGEQIELFSLRDIGCETDIPETGKNLEENALIKAQYVSQHFHLDCFADDTGLEVEALNGEPGVYSARYAGGEGHDSLANIHKLLTKLEGITNRKARFRTVIALIMEEKIYTFEGIVNGTIITTPSGKNGFGYDPIFVPEGYEQTFAELGENVKNQISHRAKAVTKLTDFLKKQQ